MTIIEPEFMELTPALAHFDLVKAAHNAQG
jgi:hypothetical protein